MEQGDAHTSDAEVVHRNATITTPLVKSHDMVDEEQAISYQKTKLSFEEGEEPESESYDGLKGRFILLTVAFLYGSLNVALRRVYEMPGPPSASALSTSRGWLAAFCFVPFLVQHKKPSPTQGQPQRPLIWAAVELAFYNFGAQALLNLGLMTVESARASFLTQTTVVMTPVISAIIGHHVHWQLWAGCLMALGGLVLLANTGGVSLAFSAGDVLVLVGAFCWSLYVIRIAQIGHAYDEVMLQGVKNVALACLYTVWFVYAALHSDVSLWEGWASPMAWAVLAYSAAGPGAIADVLQQVGQSTTSASAANVILSMEPVFTAVLGLVVLGESITMREVIGGGIIVAASIISSAE